MPVLAGSGKHLAAPAASGEAVGLAAPCQPCVSPVSALCQSCAHPGPCHSHNHSQSHGNGVWGSAAAGAGGFGRKLTALRVCTRLNTDLGAFLEYKGAWET